MTHAGAISSLLNLLCHTQEDEVLRAVPPTLGRCAESFVNEQLYLPAADLLTIPPVTLIQRLVGLLDPGCLKVRLAAAEAIKGIAGQACDVSQELRRAAVLQLCHLFSDCRDLSDQELVTSAIGALQPFHDNRRDDSLKDAIAQRVVRPFLDLLDHQSVEMQARACRALRGPILMDDDMESVIVSHLKPLLSHSDDEIWVEAAWTTLRWTWHDWLCRHQYLPASIVFTTLRRLVCLLSHEKEQVVVSATRALAAACSSRRDDFDFWIAFAHEGGLRQLIRLCSSESVDVIAAAAEFVEMVVFGLYEVCGECSEIVVAYGIPDALVCQLARDSHHFPVRMLEVLFFLLLGEPMRTDVAGHLTRILSSDDLKAYKVIQFVRDSERDETSLITLRNAGFIAPLLQFAQRTISPAQWHGFGTLERMHTFTVICYFIDESETS
jgi:hypothetical protein